MRWCSRVAVGDVIYLCVNDCVKLCYAASVGEYVVEDVKDSGGWLVQARKLDDTGKYRSDNPVVQFQQSVGYQHSLPSVQIVRQMSRIFI